MIEVIKGDLLESREKFIAHQCNAVSNQAGGIAYYIFKKFPYSNIYEGRSYPYKATGINFPGHCFIKGDGIKNRFVINMIAQYYPGTPKNDSSLLDGYNARQGYFNRCLNEICGIKDIKSIAFPFNIGCGMAGGNWTEYYRMIESFDKRINATQNVKIVLYNNE